MKALTEKAGFESEKVELASVEKTATKKKVRIVKKIVKKKVLKKVPKRVSVAFHCNDLENVATPNPKDNSPMEIQASVPVVIEKPNVAINDIKEVENTKEFEVSDRETDARLIGIGDCCRDETERSSDLVSAPLSGDHNQIELHNTEQVSNSMEHVGEEIDESVKEQSEKTECDDVKLEVDMEEQVENKEEIDMKPSDTIEVHEGMKEMTSNSETDGLKLQEGSSEKQVPSISHLKHMTKIFIHGLDKETKEEDIRKVFEEVGEVVEVKVITNFRSGKTRGCGFIRYSSSDLAKLALKKYNNVEICGKVCRTAAVDGSDTILLNNINKNWNNEHVLALLQKIGIKNIDEVSVVPDPKNPKLNRGFAYLELETKRDAQIVYQKLQNKNIFGNNSNIKVTWAQSLVEEEIHNSNNNTNNSTKSVYAENIPSTWDEKEVRGHFGKFGEIESIALAKNLRSSKRNDFAFVNYKTCEGAHSCVEVLTSGKSTGGDGVKVSLSRTIPKVKPVNGYFMPHKGQIVSGFEDGKSSSSTTDELLKLLREQASWKHGGPSLTQAHNHHHQPPFERESLYHDPRAYHQPHFQTPNVSHLRSTTNGANMRSFPHFDPQHAHYTSGSFNAVGDNNPRYFQTRDQASYHGSGSSVYRQMR